MYKKNRHKNILQRIGAYLLVIILIIMITIASVTMRSVAAADTPSVDGILTKTLLNALRTCYQSTYMVRSENGLDYRQFGIKYLFTKDGKNNQIILVPNELGNNLKSSAITCQEVFLGADRGINFLWMNKQSMDGLLTLTGKPASELSDLGYVLSNRNPDNQGCIALEYLAPNAEGRMEDHTTNSVCFDLNDDGTFTPSSNGWPQYTINYESSGGPVTLLYDNDFGLTISASGATSPTMSQQIGLITGGMTWSAFTDEVDSNLKGTNPNWFNPDPFGSFMTWRDDSPIPQSMGLSYESMQLTSPEDDVFVQYEMDGSSALRAVRYFTGNENAQWADVKFSPDEAYALLETYFERMLEDRLIFIDNNCTSNRDEIENEYAHFDGEGMWCGVRVNSSTDLSNTYNVINTDTYSSLKTATLQEILQQLTDWSFDYAEDPDNPTIGGLDDQDGSGDETEPLGEGAEVCFQAASSLGWIICPVIQGVGGMLEGIYDNVIRNQFLEVDASLLGEGNDSIYQGWATFRNIANIVFIILFILVILSQVTGVGISNYGIKKMLPRLIAVALLVNLSYIICQLAVDVSNILGYGLESMLESLSNDVPAPDTIGSFAHSLLKSLFSTAASGAAAAGGIVLAISSWSYWLFPLLLFLLGCLISIIFFAIILGIRSAGILILVAVAPIAIVCYALPNLKKVFDRWLKIFSSLLLVFPLCGLLMGGGIYASRLLLSVSANADENVGFFFQLIAMLLQVVPFFFIPSLVKHSMTAIGNLGAKISGFGSKISSGAQGALRKSERVQDWNKRIRVGQQYRRAQRAMTRAEAKGKTLSPARARQIARAKAAYEKQGIEDASNRHYAGRSQAQIDAAVAAAAVAAEDKDLQDAATALETQYKKSGMDYRFDDMQQVHRDALDALMRDPTDRNAKAKLKASQNILSATDPGRARLKDNFYNASGQIQRETNQQMRSAMDSAASWAAQSLERAHGADIKAHDRSFHKYLTDQAQGISAVKGGFAAGSIGQDDRGQDIQGTRATSYDTGNISGLTAATLAGTDENALDRILQTTRNDYDPQGRLSDDDKRRFLAMSEEMFKNENIAVQPKVADKVNAIRKALGAAELEPSVRNSSSSGDSGTINVRGQATNGAPILRTGNDGQAPMPSGATMTDSGIIIGHENMSDHEIAQYAEEMQQFNTRQRQTGGQGRTGGGQSQSGQGGQGGQGSQSS